MWYHRTMPARAAAIGRTLSRLGRMKRRSSTQSVVSPSRWAVYQAVVGEGDSVAIDRISALTGLHANTVRPHLDVLQAAGLVTREQEQREGRGRPRWRYRAVEAPQDRERRALALALQDQLDGADSPELAAAAAYRWAEHLANPVGEADSADEAVSQAADAMSGLGFDVSVTPAQDRIDLMKCPYADLVAERPVICDIHAALLQQLFSASGQPVEITRLDVWSAPGVCTAHLRRNEAPPHRSIMITNAD